MMVDELLKVLDPDRLTPGEILLAIVVVIVAALLMRYTRRAVETLLQERRHVSARMVRPVALLAGLLVLLTGILIALAIVGMETTPLVLIILFVGGFLGISLRGILENYAAGIVLQFTAPFSVGSHIETNGVLGRVEDVDGSAVVLATQDRGTVRVPNRDVLGRTVSILHEHERRRSEVAFTVAHSVDVAEARTVTQDAVASVGRVSQEPAPTAYLVRVGEKGVDITVRFFHASDDVLAVEDQVIEAIIRAFDAAGLGLVGRP